MKKQQRAAFVQATLEAFFPHPKIPLQHEDPYTLLIAVLLSAQSTDTRVNACTPALFAMAATPEKMVQIAVEEIERIIRPIGLAPAKSRAIWNLSHILLEQYGGKVPCTFAALERLPGVGHKTASVVMAQGFGIPAMPVDTHIHRCAKRWGLSTGKSVKKTEEDLKQLFPEHTWNKLHLQMIYFARAFCPARGHHVEACPICAKLGRAKY